ncbi:hypothetical protein FDECE_12098 [Fusarium decemcellulare]|nr:hypothetical protein FDECE_12098 [Fusarium decemcellulare]
MSSNDAYCAICGAPAHEIDIDSYDTSRVSDESAAWLDRVNILARGSEGPQREAEIFFTGPVDYRDYNWYETVTTNTQVEEQLGSDEIRVYDWHEFHDVLVPLHDDCYDLLKKVAAPRSITLEVIYETLKGHCPDEDAMALDFDYGDASTCQGEHWKRIGGMEYLVASPTNIPRVEEFMKLILADSKLQESDEPFAVSPQKDDTNKDALNSLPGELMSSMLESLDYDSICAMRLASRSAVTETSSNNAFWKNKLLSEMPWMLEYLPSTDDLYSSGTDWFKLYKAMRAISKGKDGRHPFTTAGLQNRCRIWGLCCRILEEYEPRSTAHADELKHKSPVLEKANNTIQPPLRYPRDPGGVIWSTIGLIHTFEDIRSARPVISVFWSKNGELAGIGSYPTLWGTQRAIGSKDVFTTTDTVQIPGEAWITELVITSQDEIDESDLDKITRKVVGLQFIFSEGDPVQVGQSKGDVRVISPDPGHFVIGFQVSWAPSKPISHLSLLFQPMKNAPEDIIHRLEPQKVLDEDGDPVPHNKPEVTGHLWKNELPPRELEILSSQNGYMSPNLKTDDLLMEPLIFGTTERDLDMISAIGVDAQLRGFELCLDNGHEKWTRIIGHPYAMQYLSIDGRGGERILHCYVAISDVARGIRFLTNRGRNLIVGDCKKRGLVRRGEQPKPHLGPLMGIYCHWSNRHTPGTDLTAVGTFSRKFRTPVRIPEMVTDEQGRYWTPTFPPTAAKDIGPIFGQHEFTPEGRRVSRHIPDDDATVSWLDCSRPIESIKVALCHGTTSSRLALVSLSLKYSDDQTTSSIGPTKFSSPRDTHGRNGNYWCWCAEGSRRDEELQEHPHYIEDSWNAEGCLKFVQLWVDDDGALTGLQFITQDGKQSPAWGYCVGERPVKLPLQAQKKNRAAGLKVFIDRIDRGVLREDYVVVAVQLIGFPAADMSWDLNSHQSTAVANITVTTGYLATLISVSAQCLLPRAKYLKILFFALLASCMAAALCCLACYTAIKARGSHSTGDGVNTGLGVYDSTASAVSGIWLFVMIWVANGIRAWRPSELQDPMVAFSIFVVTAQDVSAHFCAYLQHITEKVPPFPGDPNDARTRVNGDAEADRTNLAASVKKLHILLDNIEGNMQYVMDEVAFGKLSGSDIGHVARLLRHLLRPLSGLAEFPELVDKLGQEGLIWEADLRHEKAAAPDQTRRTIASINANLSTAHGLFTDGLRFSMAQLEIGEGIDPSHQSSISQQESSLNLPNEIRRHIEETRKVGWQDENETTDTSYDSEQHPSALYLQSMHAMVLEATLALASFALSKTRDGTMARRRVVYPKHLFSFRFSRFKTEASDPKKSLRKSRQAPDGSKVINAEHMEPDNAWQKTSGHFRIIPRLLGSDLSVFGLRVAVASFSVAIVAYLADTYEFFIRQRGVWAMIVIVIGMGATSGQSASGFIARIMATVVSLALSFASWYIVVGNTAGVIVLLFIANIIEYYFYVKKPQYFKPSMIALVTLNVIIGYELQVKKLGKERAESGGQPYYPIYLFGPYKLACVVIGCAVSFFWVVFPYPITAKSKVPGLVGQSLFNLARFYSHVHNSSWGPIQENNGLSLILTGPDSPSRMILATLYRQQLHIFTGLRAHMDYAKYEPPIGGRFPLAIYNEMTSLSQQTLDILALMAHIGFSTPFDGDISDQEPTTESTVTFATISEFSNLHGYETVLLLCQMSSALQNKQPLPPFMSVSGYLTPIQQFQKLENDIRHTTDVQRQATSVLVTIRLLEIAMYLKLRDLLEHTTVLVGKVSLNV